MLLVLVALLLSSTSGVSGPSLTVDQAQPVSWGEPLSFTAVYTSANKKSWPPRIYNPTVAVECSGWRGSSFLGHKEHDVSLGGGWWQGDFAVGAPVGSGAGTCSAWLEFTSGDGVTSVLAATQFGIQD